MRTQIDAAIKRPGRIDRSYLVLPPDDEARMGIIRRQLKKARREKCVENLSAADRQRVNEASIFLAFGDIRSAVNVAINSGDEGHLLSRLCDELREQRRTVSLAMYETRFRNANDQKEVPPEEEFICLLAMADGHKLVLDGAERAISEATMWFSRANSKERRASIEAAINRAAPKLGAAHKEKVIRAMCESDVRS